MAIGAIIASVVIVAVMFGLNGTFNETKLAIKPTPQIDSVGPAEITMETFVENGSPVLGNTEEESQDYREKMFSDMDRYSSFEN